MKFWRLIQNRPAIDERTANPAITAVEADFEVIADEPLKRAAQPHFVQIAERSRLGRRFNRGCRWHAKLHLVRNNQLSVGIQETKRQNVARFSAWRERDDNFSGSTRSDVRM